MRKQYHFRPSPNGFHAWDVDRLIRLSAGFEARETPLEDIRELDEDYWFAGSAATPTCRRIVEHIRLTNEADLRFPVILCAQGRIMDGMHRVAKALLENRSAILSVRFARTPEPDYTDVTPDQLSY